MQGPLSLSLLHLSKFTFSNSHTDTYWNNNVIFVKYLSILSLNSLSFSKFSFNYLYSLNSQFSLSIIIQFSLKTIERVADEEKERIHEKWPRKGEQRKEQLLFILLYFYFSLWCRYLRFPSIVVSFFRDRERERERQPPADFILVVRLLVFFFLG